jgi:hypothetical protein
MPIILFSSKEPFDSQEKAILASIRDKSEEDILLAIPKNPWLMTFMINPSEKIIVAACESSPELIAYIKDPTNAAIDACINASFAKENYGIIHFAVENNLLKLADLILDRYPPTEEVLFKGGRTPFLLAAHHGHSDMCLLLKNRGADIHATTQRRGNAIGNCFISQPDTFMETIRTLLEMGVSGHNTFKDAVAAGNPKLVSMLIKSGISLECTKDNNETAFQMAADLGDFAMCYFLQSLGADIQANIGGNALVRCLRDVTKVNTKQFGYTATRTFQEHEKSLTKFVTLLEMGVSMTNVDEDGESAYTMALKMPKYCDIAKAAFAKSVVLETLEKSMQQNPVRSTRQTYF